MANAQEFFPVTAESLSGSPQWPLLDLTGTIEGADTLSPEQNLKDVLKDSSAKKRPRIVVVGSHAVTAEMMAHLPAGSVIVRRGTGLESIDRDAARENGIWVLNTPRANAPFVGAYSAENLNVSESTEKVAFIGMGGNHFYALQAFLSQPNGTAHIFTPSTSTAKDQLREAQQLQNLAETFGLRIDFPSLWQSGRIVFSNTAAAAVENANAVAISTSNRDGYALNESDIFPNRVCTLALGAHVVCVSPRGISVEAARALSDWPNLGKLVIDGAPAHRAAYASLVSDKVSVVGRAMAAEGCKKGMDAAVTEVINFVRQSASPATALACPVQRNEQPIHIIGAGVVGLMMAYYAILSGHPVTVYDADSPNSNDQLGTSHNSPVRQLSATEAGAPNPETILLWNEQGGSLSGETLAALKRQADGTRPVDSALRELEAYGLNIAGLKGWELIRSVHQALIDQGETNDLLFQSQKELDEVFINASPVRVVLGDPKALQAVVEQQKRSGPDTIVRIMTAEEVRNQWPDLTLETIAGAVEVRGGAINIEALQRYLRRFISENGGQIHNNTHVTEVGNGQIHTQGGVTFDITGGHVVYATGAPLEGMTDLHRAQEREHFAVQGGWLIYPGQSKKGIPEILKVHSDPSFPSYLGVTNVTTLPDGRVGISAGFMPRESGSKNNEDGTDPIVAALYHVATGCSLVGQFHTTAQCFRDCSMNNLFGALGLYAGGTVRAPAVGQHVIMECHGEQNG